MKLIRGQAADIALGKSSGAYSERTAAVLPGILEGSDDLFAAIDAELRLVAFNAAFRRGVYEASGVMPQLNQTLEEVLPEGLADLAMLSGLCRRALAGEALQMPLAWADARGRQTFYDVSFSPVRDPAGNTVVVAVGMRDVTDKRITEQKLRGVLEAAPDPTIVVRDGIIEFANAQMETLFGYAPGALPGMPLESLVPERLRERHALLRTGFERSPRTRPMGADLALQGLRADGSEFPVEISLSPLAINGDQLVVAAVRDVTARKRAEDELRSENGELRRQLVALERRQGAASELEIYRASFEKAPAGLFHYASDGRIKRVNQRFCELLDYRSEELLQMTVEKITCGEDIALSAELDGKLLAGTLERYAVDKRLLRKDGSAVWVRAAVAAERSSGGEPDYVIAVVEDISDKRRAEEALREAQLRLAMAAEIAQVGYAELDLDTRKVYLSPELKRQIGYAEAELPNDFAEWSRRLHPEDAARATAAVEQLVAEPRGGLRLEYRLRHKDESYHWFLKRGIALEDFPGHAKKLLLTQIDITERRAAEKKLREQSEELQLALRVASAGTFQWNAQTHEHQWCDEMLALYGLKREEFGRQDDDWLACLLPEDRASAMAAVERSLKTGDYAADFRIRRRSDGEVRWLSGRGRVFFDAEGVAKRMVGINVDVTEQRRVNAELEASKRRLEAVLASLKEGVVIFDLGGQVVDANPAAVAIMGYATAADAHRRLQEFVDTFAARSLDGRDLPLEEWPIGRVLRGESFTDYEIVVQRKDDGSTKILSHNGAPVRNADGTAILGVLTMMDVTDRKRAEERARAAALHCPLTGLPNRALVFEYGEHLLAAARRGHGKGALLFIDLDRFKPINDLYGHEIGDRVLQEVGRRLLACVRHEDLAGRLGGDEFVIVLPHLDDVSHRAAVVAQHIVDSISQPFRIDGLELSISPSVGISCFPEHASDINQLIHAADLAMYRAKQSGRGNFQFYTPELDRRSEEAVSLEAKLKDALRHDRLALHYQPVVDIANGELIGAEALLRLPDDNGEPVGPASFIPVAEACGLIGDLGAWVATEACRQHGAWLREGLRVSIAINVSPLQFRQRDFPDKLGCILSDSGVDPACLELEVSESAVMESLDEAVEILRRIKSLGVKVALDDLGTGYTSLSRLGSLPIDKLKVDQSFVRRVDSDQASRAVTDAILALGHSLHLDVVGEGIESEGALRYLQEHGCNQAQGYLFSQPLPATEFAQWYRQQRGH